MILQPNKPSLELPFKPFTVDEICDVCKVRPKVLDLWIKGCKVLEQKWGSGAIGLEYMQTFAIFVAKHFQDEGADWDRIHGIIIAICSLSLEGMQKEFVNGNTFAVYGKTVGPGAPPCVMVPAPKSRLGSMLRLDKLHAEFRHELARVFPGTPT